MFVWQKKVIEDRLWFNEIGSNSQDLLSFNFLENCQFDRCTHGGILKTGNYLESKNKKYRLYLRKNGNLVVACGGRAMWSSLTIDDMVDFLYFEKEGLNLILHGKDNSTIWRMPARGKGHTLLLLDDGNLVLYNHCNKSVWEAGSNKNCPTGLHFLLCFEFFIISISIIFYVFYYYSFMALHINLSNKFSKIYL